MFLVFNLPEDEIVIIQDIEIHKSFMPYLRMRARLRHTETIVELKDSLQGFLHLLVLLLFLLDVVDLQSTL